MCIDSYADISIHTPTRGTTAGTGTATNLAEFQSTLPREERLYRFCHAVKITLFQSTLPREERHCLIVKTSLYSYFNPRSHERSDLKRCKYMRYKIISIHAPTRGATFSLNEVLRCPDISIHAPTRGATVEGQRYLERNVEFQSTLPREERLGKVCCDIKRIKISIHAPTRGATINIGNKIHWIIYFNPRSHERSDVKSKSKKGWCIIFQSTLPREERLGKMEMVSGPHDFNPRSHERSDK